MAKNPEQNNNQDQGPPDLDELLNDLGKKIGRLFGRKESAQKNSKPNNGSSQSEKCFYLVYISLKIIYIKSFIAQRKILMSRKL